MKIDLNRLPEHFTEADAELFDKCFEDLGDNAKVTGEQQQRILSSAMRKAGFEMKENITVKRTRKSRKRIIGAFAAAAVLTASAIGAASYYSYVANRGSWDAVKYKFEGSDSIKTEEQVQEAAETIESILTTDGECEINTFDDLDIAYDGSVADQDDFDMLFTIRRRDGVPFEEKEGYIWMVKYAEGWYAYDSDDTLYPNYHDASHFEINPDGSLSLALSGSMIYNSDYEKYDYRLGFTDICYVPYSVWKRSSGDGVVYDLGTAADIAALDLLGESTLISADEPFITRYDNKLTGEAYDEAYAIWQQKDQAYTDALKEVSEYYYSGKLLYRIPASSLQNDVPQFSKEHTGSDFEVTISPQRITLRSDGVFDEAKEQYANEDKVTITLHYLDGSTDTIELFGGKGGAYGLSDGSWQEFYTFEFIPNTPVKAENVAYIMLGDVKINING